MSNEITAGRHNTLLIVGACIGGGAKNADE